jgi:hypothetical protein
MEGNATYRESSASGPEIWELLRRNVVSGVYLVSLPGVCPENKIEVSRNELMKRIGVWAVFAASTVAIAQRTDNGLTCTPGTPIPFNSDGAWGYVTSAGALIAPQFKSAMYFSSGVAAVCRQDICGLIDVSGQPVRPFRQAAEQNIAVRYAEGVGPIAQGNLWGYANLSGNVIIPPKFEYAGDFESGLAVVRLKGKYFFINHGGERVTPEFDGLFHFNENLAAAIVGNKVGYIDRNGKFVLPPNYDGSSGIDFSEGLVAVRIGGRVGFIDKRGAVVVPPAYDDAYPFSEGLARVRVGDRWGYIDKTGKMIIQAKYSIGHMFNEGVASVHVSETGKWGFLDHSGTFLIAPEFDSALPFCAGIAQVETYKNIGRADGMLRRDRVVGRRGLIDHSGRYIWRDPVDHEWLRP